MSEPAKVAERRKLKLKAPRSRRYVKTELGPRPIVDPETGEIVGERPARTVYEWREPRSGRPPVKDELALLWIVRACRVEEWEEQEKSGQRQVVDGKSPLRQVAEIGYSLKWGNSVAAVEKQLRRTLKDKRDRAVEFPDGGEMGKI